MKVISISQPFANLIVRGVKNIENLNFNTSYRGKVLIYANKKTLPKTFDGLISKYGPDFYQEFINQYYFGNLEDFDKFTYGAIIGYATLKDVTKNFNSPWALEDSFKFVFEDAHYFPIPISIKINSKFQEIDFDENLLEMGKKFQSIQPKIIDNTLNISLNNSELEVTKLRKLIVLENSFSLSNLLDDKGFPKQFDQAFVNVDDTIYTFRIKYVAFRESFDFMGEEFFEICAIID